MHKFEILCYQEIVITDLKKPMLVFLKKFFLTGFVLFAMLAASGILHLPAFRAVSGETQISFSLNIDGSVETAFLESQAPQSGLAHVVAFEPTPCQSENACSSPTCTSLFLAEDTTSAGCLNSDLNYQAGVALMTGLFVSPPPGPPRA